jgi:dolichol-phosphate mannosyltransferase
MLSDRDVAMRTARRCNRLVGYRGLCNDAGVMRGASSIPAIPHDGGSAGTFKTAARSSECLVFAPTYNESRNIGPLIEALLRLEPRCDVLIVDDSSTDGTTAFLAGLAAAEPRLHIIIRPGKLGIGSAHKLAWLYARRQGYARIVTLDADLSHDPADVPRLLAALDTGADAAFGSRYMPGGSLDYHGWRLFLSRNANRLARFVLRLPFAEYTTSLRAARLDRVPVGLVEGIASDGYSFFMACAVGFARAGLRIAEIPIHFRDRDHGVSKIPRTQILRGAVNLMRLVLQRRRQPSAPLPPDGDRCPACGGPSRVTTASGERRCLACLDGPTVRPR